MAKNDEYTSIFTQLFVGPCIGHFSGSGYLAGKWHTGSSLIPWLCYRNIVLKLAPLNGLCLLNSPKTSPPNFDFKER